MPTTPASAQEVVHGLATALPGDRLRNGAALLGLVSLGLGTMLSPAAIYIGLAILLVVSLTEGRGFLRFLLRSPWAWLAMAVTVYTLVRTLLAQQAFPEQAEAIDKYGGQLMIVAGIPALLLGWQLARRPRWLAVLLTAFVVSLGVFFFQEAGWSTLVDYLQGNHRRLQFGGHKNAIGGLYGAGILAALYLLYRCLAGGAWLGGRGWRRVARYGLELLLVGTLVLFALVVLWNQSRTAWLALLVTLLVPVAYLLRARRSSQLGLGRTAALALPVIGVLGVAALLGQDLVERRADQLTRHIDRVDEIRVDARIGAPQEARIRAYLAGGDAFLQKPLLGWGPGHVRPLLAAAGADDLLHLGHFHNFYLQLAVGLGLVGLLGFLALYLLPLWYQRPSKGDAALPASMRVFAISLWVYVMVLGLATIRHDDPPGQALYVMALGVAAMGLGVRYRGRLGR